MICINRHKALLENGSLRPSRQDSAHSAACLPACVQESSLTLVLCIFSSTRQSQQPNSANWVLGSKPSPCQYYDWPPSLSINTGQTHSPNDWPRSLRPASSLTFTGLGKMAPLRVTMTDLDGTRLRPELPGTTETSPPLLPLGPLQRAPGRTAIRASRQAAEDAISCSAPRRDPHPAHPVRPSRRKPASSLARLSNTRPHSPYACAVPALLSPWESPGHPPYVVTSGIQRRPSRTPEGGAVRLELRL